MARMKQHIMAAILGIGFAYAAISISGLGAAIAIPSDFLKPVAQVSGLLALSLVDFVTIAVPLAAAFLVLTWFSKLLIKTPDATFYLLLLAPFGFMQLYFVTQSQPQMLNIILTTLPRYLLLAGCFYWLACRTNQAKTEVSD